MAFGLGFNKSKILQYAEKYVIQGKIPAAIAEYKKILQKDPKDLLSLNAVGDLYHRAGDNKNAVDIFFSLAEKSIEAGYVPRAIAVYKRITKIEHESLPAIEKLGELYSMQGLLRDARTHYLQAVEIHSKRSDWTKAREVFERILLLDMDNPKLLRKMAELYAQTRMNSEAVQNYLSSAERYLEKNEPSEAASVLEALLILDPVCQEALVLRGRAKLEQGDPDAAIKDLESLPAYQSNQQALTTLFQAHKKQGNLDRAKEIAQQLIGSYDDFTTLNQFAQDLLDNQDVAGSMAIYLASAEKLQAQNRLSEIIGGLKNVLQVDAENLDALQLLWLAYRQTGEIGEGRETAERLGHAYTAAENLEKAREVFQELVQMEPDNPDNVQLLRQIDGKLGTTPPEKETNTDTPIMAMEVPDNSAEQSEMVQALPPRERTLVTNCITESELYITYKQNSRAIETLENGLQEVPGNISLYEHLLPLYERTSEFRKAAKCAEALTEGYVRMGDGERATRYGELILTFQQKAEAAGEAAPPGVESAAPSGVQETIHEIDLSALPADTEESTEEQAQVREVDLSSEWESLSESGSATTKSEADSLVEEIEFYFEAGLMTEAASAVDRLRAEHPGNEALAGFDKQIADEQPEPAEPVAEIVDAPAEPEPPMAVLEPVAGLEPPAPEPDEAPTPVPAPEEALVLDELAATTASPADTAFDLTLNDPATDAPATEEALELDELATPAAPTNTPFELALDEARTDSLQQLTEMAAEPPPAERGVKEPAGGLLDDLFSEFKDDMEEPAAAGEDSETHYNMGVAFKEMSLYDEAIGEFQKVHEIAVRANDYSNVVQCCSLLATCFLGKDLPLLAVRWYQTALDAPGVDAESSMAILFEMGAAYELAGDRESALKSFMEVYARNIDYRNVAERIQDLEKSS